MDRIFVSHAINNNVKEQFEILFKVLDFDEDIGGATVCDSNGVILAVSQSFLGDLEIDAQKWIGKTVYDLEKENIYKPSVSARVLKEKRRMTLIHKNHVGKDIITTSVPIFKEGTDIIKYVVSFAAVNIQNEYGINKQINDLKDKLNEYKKKIDQLNDEKESHKGLIIFGKKMQQVKETCEHIAKIEANVLITGESGVGKNVVAKFIHNNSNRAKKNFLEINCSSIPENLIESELFGYEKGSFTGASDTGKKGLIEMATGGTLFLDEIGELPLNIQSKLLSVIQSKQVLKIGATKANVVDFRLITATNKNLMEEIASKKFREDLYYRLNVIPIHIDPLRERRDEIEYMTKYFLDIFNKKYSVDKRLSNGTMHSFIYYNWPGNVRELENLVERLVVITKGDTIHYECDYGIQDQMAVYGDCDFGGKNLKEIMENYEKQVIMQSYSKYRSSVKVGRDLGIGQTTASKKIRKYVNNNE